MNLFSSSSSSTSPSLTQPPPMLYDSPLPSPALSASNSPRPSLTRPPSIIPKPEMDHESPEVYVSRLRLAVSKAEMAGILAASADSFHSRALRAYISEFDFTDDPLDVALRKLLMHVGLPRETQQIDRVMEAFAVQYLECNRNLFISDDHPYILAFSLIMLHTDAFNKSNKRKMTKADYIKNTRLPGVPSEVLDCFYDNIVFSPFIFLEDPVDVNGQRGLLSESATPVRALSLGNPLSASTSSAASLLGKPAKVDVYDLIAKNNLGHLRVNIDAFVPRTTPYSWQGTAGPWDEPELQMAFAKPTMIEVGTAASVQVMPASFGAAGATPLTPSFSGSFAESAGPLREVTTIRITKVGLLMRKDDFLEGGKKSFNRKWRSYSTILTGSQLLFFRDSTWANVLAPACSADDAPPLPQTVFRPDELLSVRDCVAVFDTSYTKHNHVLRLVMPDGRQLLLQASNDDELNQWIARINYASTFKTAGIRMRPLGMSGKDVQLTGVAAATSHLHDLQHAQTAHRSRKWDNDAPLELMGMLNGPESPVKRQSVHKRATVSFGAQMELEVPTAPEIDGADQFKATFDNVKAELAAGHWSSIDSPLVEEFSSSSRSISLPSRTTIIQKKVDELKAKKSAASTQLDSDMRFVLNIGTLTPFQKATHDRLATAVRTISKRIMQVRLEMARLECHSEVLKSDIDAESRSWSEAKKVALQAATETLQQQQNRGEERIPRTIISFPEKTQTACDSVPDLSLRKRSSSSYHRPDSTADSFHSALDYSEDNLSSSGYLRVDTSSQGSTTSIPSDPDADGDAGPPSGRTPDTSHEKFYTAVESPEEWDQTRAGKRVSLVRLPSTYGLQRFSSARTTNSTNSTMPMAAEGDL
ncbi:Sec7 domain protein [Mycena kentingensis (nom. inval.)]|nr:Sec7 domain protein [Mycena kentingensis (nom. inval.)]